MGKQAEIIPGFFQAIIDTLVERIRALLIEMRFGCGDEECWEPKEAAAFLKIKPSILSELSHSGKIPCRNLGLGEHRANFRYSKTALVEWLRAQKDEL